MKRFKNKFVYLNIINLFLLGCVHFRLGKIYIMLDQQVYHMEFGGLSPLMAALTTSLVGISLKSTTPTLRNHF